MSKGLSGRAMLQWISTRMPLGSGHRAEVMVSGVVDLLHAVVLRHIAQLGEGLRGPGEIVSPHHDVQIAHRPEGEALVDDLAEMSSLEDDHRDAMTPQLPEDLRQVAADLKALRGTTDGGGRAGARAPDGGTGGAEGDRAQPMVEQ